MYTRWRGGDRDGDKSNRKKAARARLFPPGPFGGEDDGHAARAVVDQK